MADFNLEACHRYWNEFSDVNVYRALAALESMESWTLDGTTEIEEAMTELGKQLTAIRDLSDDIKKQIVHICAYIKSSRTLMVLQTLDSLSPGSASRVIQYAEKNADTDEVCKLFVNRNVAFERFRLLRTVLSTERLQLISRSMEIMHEDA